MQELNLPDYSSVLTINSYNNTIFDICRNKYVALTPEEWVRQNFIHFIINELKYSKGLISVEMEIKFNNLKRRCDIVCFNREGIPKLIIECKAPDVKITQEVFNQIATYNLKLNVDYLIITNGMEHYCCKMLYNET